MAEIFACQVEVLDGSTVSIDVNVSYQVDKNLRCTRHTLKVFATPIWELACTLTYYNSVIDHAEILLLCTYSTVGYWLAIFKQKRTIGEVLLSEVFKHLGLEETDYFGLQYLDTKEQVVSLYLISCKHNTFGITLCQPQYFSRMYEYVQHSVNAYTYIPHSCSTNKSL